LCEIQNSLNLNPFTDEELDRFVDDVWKGINTTSQLSRLMYYKTADKLTEGLRLGLAIGAEGIPEEDNKYRLAKDLQQNIYRFSGAKTYQQTLQLNKLLVGENGEARTYGQFKKEASKVLDTFNSNYLAAEYQRTVAGSQNAIFWDKIEETKHLLPYLQYETVGDQRVRPTHQALDGIVRKVDDPFWLSYMPPNGWNCRCTVLQLEEAEETDMTNFEQPKDVPDEFLMNTGKQRIIFNDKHPYYEVHPRDMGLAVNNFNLPIPQTPTKELVGPVKGAVGIDNIIPKELKEWGIENDINKEVFSYLNKPLDSLKIPKKKNEFYHQTNNVYIDINSARWKRSAWFRKKIFDHEVGHAVHTQRNLIKTANGHVSEEYSNHFNSLKKLIKGKEAEIEKELHLKTFAAFRKDVSLLQGELSGYTFEDCKEMIGCCLDTLQALTNNRYARGEGHKISYFERKGAKEAEVFAHSMENAIVGNPVFKKVMPEVYEESIKFIKYLKK
jgi:SPP1 gp7 family putative phage head morphogenesis protein